ncbi:MAG: hypothetical protein WC389_13015 [Lutibacter sp.]|jgi:hypothetical protein
MKDVKIITGVTIIILLMAWAIWGTIPEKREIKPPQAQQVVMQKNQCIEIIRDKEVYHIRIKKECLDNQKIGYISKEK